MHHVRDRTKRRHRRILTAAGTALALVLGLLVGPLSTAAQAATVDTTRNNAWTAFGNNTNTNVSQWSGGDGTIGVKLPDGRVSFGFSDTFRGPVTPEGFHPPFQTAGVFNSMVMASSSAANASLSTVLPQPDGNNWGAQPLVPWPYGGNNKLWAGDGAVYNNQLVRLYVGLTVQGPDCYVFGKPHSTYIAKFSLPAGSAPTLNTAASYKVDSPDGISWGTAILNDGGYTYIYGSEDLFGANCAPAGRRLHIARVPTGQFDQPWEYLADLPMPNGLSSEFSVAKLGSTYLLVTQDYGHTIVAYASSTPASFGGAKTNLYDIPVYKSTELMRYAGRMQPALTTSSEIVLSYNVNSTRRSQDGCIDETVLDASIYRPRFVRVPRSALPTASSSARAPAAAETAAPVLPPGGASQRPATADTWWPQKTKTGVPGAAPRAGTTAKAAAAAVPLPIGSVTWVRRTFPGEPRICGVNIAPANFTAVPDPLPARTVKVSWDYKGPTVETSVARWTPGEGWAALPLMLLGASFIPAVPAIQGPPVDLLSGSPRRVRWTDTPFATSGQAVRYQICAKPADRAILPEAGDENGQWELGEFSPDCSSLWVTMP